MLFYEIDEGLRESIESRSGPVRLRIQIDVTGAGYFETVIVYRKPPAMPVRLEKAMPCRA